MRQTLEIVDGRGKRSYHMSSSIRIGLSVACGHGMWFRLAGWLVGG